MSGSLEFPKAAEISPQAPSPALLTLFILICTAILLGGYHLLVLKPLLDEAKGPQGQLYYVADLEALSEAKVVSMLRKRDATGVDLSEQEVNAEMMRFREQLRADFLELSSGAPIFQKQTIIHARKDIDDLTVVIAEKYGLDLNDTVDNFFAQKTHP
jgi:hypothetical protein